MNEVITEIERQLAWTGPGGRVQGHIVLTREQATALVTELRAQINAQLERPRPS
jgi:hypothetical protein